MESKSIDVRGVRTRYLEAGAGEPLLLLHGGHPGLHTSADVWSLNIPDLARSFRVLAIDKIGCGFTDNPKTDGDYTIGAGVSHAWDFIQALGIKGAHVVGHSRGGFQACRLALEHPEAVKTLTIVDSGTLIIRSIPMSVYEVNHKPAPRIADTRERFRRKLADYSFSPAHLTDDFIDALLQVAALPKEKEAAAKMEAGLKNQFRDDLKASQQEAHEMIREGRLKCPTLLVWGYNDPAAKLDPVGMEALQLIMPNVPRSQMVILNQAGHFCFREQPAAFNAAVTRFVRLNSPQC